MLRPLLDDGEQDPKAMKAMRRETAERLRAARGERSAIIAAIEEFLDFGDAGEYSPAVLWDYFCISSPTIPALAGYDAVGEDRIIRIFSTCTHARYGGGEPLPPDWPWFEKDK
jgi:hypothetical protein